MYQIDLNVFKLPTCNSNSCENVYVEIGLDKNESLIVGCIYRDPSYDLKCFEESYVNILKSFKSSPKYVILEDFNIHYDKINQLSGITDYANHVQSVSCLQLINKSTLFLSHVAAALITFIRTRFTPAR